jgi:hypothetical protein
LSSPRAMRLPVDVTLLTRKPDCPSLSCSVFSAPAPPANAKSSARENRIDSKRRPSLPFTAGSAARTAPREAL